MEQHMTESMGVCTGLVCLPYRWQPVRGGRHHVLHICVLPYFALL